MKDYQVCERRSRDRAAGLYDAWYAETKGRWFDRREQEIFGRAIESASVSAAVLDLGSGTGRITSRVARRDRFTVAMDFSLGSLNCLRRKGLPGVAAASADAASGLPFRTGCFDAVVSCQVVQHLKPGDLAAALRECRRVLKAGGRFHLAVYNLDYWRFHGIPEKVDDGDLYYRRFSPGNIQDLAARAGFSISRIGYYKMLPASLPWTRHLPERMFLEADRFLCAVPLLRRFASAYLFAELEARHEATGE